MKKRLELTVGEWECLRLLLEDKIRKNQKLAQKYPSQNDLQRHVNSLLALNFKITEGLRK